MTVRTTLWVMGFAAIGLFLSIALSACEPSQPPPAKAKATQAEKAAEASNAITFTENAEIDNIQARLELTSDPGLLGYVALINGVGQIVMYTPVEGKVTSGGKRLTSPDQLVKGDRGKWTGHFRMDAPSDEGTWGRSNPYVFFWTPNGQYIQTSMEYIYSDQPFRLNEEPLMLTVDAEKEVIPPPQ
jgi:hypothetical protein